MALPPGEPTAATKFPCLSSTMIGAIDERDSGLCQSRAQFEPLRLLVLDQEHDRLGNARKLLGRGQAIGALGAPRRRLH